MLVAVGGSQSAGKSLVIQQLHKAGYSIIQRKTSRSILTDWNVSLSDVNNNRDLTIQFQDEILKRKLMDEKDAIASEDIIFTERSFADLATYSTVALGKDNEYDEWLDDYYLRCMHAQQSYDMVFYLTAGHFSVQKDGVRAANKHYSTMVDLTMLNFTQQMTPTNRLNIITTPNLKERTTIINVQANSTLKRSAFNMELFASL